MALLVGLLLGHARPARADEGRLGPAPWFPMLDPATSPEETYEQNTLGIVHGGEDWRPNRGKYRSLLSRHDFFVTVGRTDLARHQAASAATSRIVFWSGVASVGVGAALVYAHAVRGGFEPSATSGLIFAGSGLLACWISTFITGPSVSIEEAEEMAHRYNQQLKVHIEHEVGDKAPPPVQAARPAQPSPRALSWIAPWIDGRSAAGLLAAAAF